MLSLTKIDIASECNPIWGDGVLILTDEGCDDGNLYDGDGCTSSCQIQDSSWYWYDTDNDFTTAQECKLKCGDGIFNTDNNEQWDDGNNFDDDGWSYECLLENGYIWTSDYPTSWYENEFRPSATMTIKSNNDILLTFNDTLNIVNIMQDDLFINIYGTKTSYSFSWTASYTNSSNVFISMDIESKLAGGKNEIIVLEFLNDKVFTSIYSNRGVNFENTYSEFLNSSEGVNTGQSFGQAALIIFLTSVLLTFISSFGGNSMEMMWNMTNTLQIFYYMSKFYTHFPNNLINFNSYLKYSNMKNVYLSQISYLLLSDKHYKRGTVNDRVEEKAFYVSSSDKLPWSLLLIAFFVLIKIVDIIKIKDDNKFMNFIKKYMNYLKYDFYIRLWLEVYLEISINASVNIYFFDFSTPYEIFSLFLAILFLLILLWSMCFCTVLLLINYDWIRNNQQNLKAYSCLFVELDLENPPALFFYIIFYFRRLILCITIVYFYKSAELQIATWIIINSMVLAYFINVTPYK